MRRSAFTLTEVVVAVAIMSIMAGVMALNSASVGQQTAKNEAERVAAFIRGHIVRENMAKRGLWFQVSEDSIRVQYGLATNLQDVSKLPEFPKLDASHGCKYTPSHAKICYHISEVILQGWGMSAWKLISDDSTVVTDSGTKGQYYITVEGADKKSLNVIIGRKL